MIIFDYATLADDSHRRHFIDPWLTSGNYQCTFSCDKRMKVGQWYDSNEKEWLPNWEAYYAAADKDVPIEATLGILTRYIRSENQKPTEIWCDIPEKYRSIVMEWIQSNWFIGLFSFEIPALSQCIKMRPNGDTTPWHELKEKWITEIIGKAFMEKKHPVEMVFERSGSRAIEMWKRYGVTVLEVHA